MRLLLTSMKGMRAARRPVRRRPRRAAAGRVDGGARRAMLCWPERTMLLAMSSGVQPRPGFP
jgi:hypothetical protein